MDEATPTESSGTTESDSGDYVKSGDSTDIISESKTKKRHGTPSLVEDDGYEVTFTVTIAMAIPTDNEDQTNLKDMLQKRTLESPRAQNYYHMEYSLVPGGEDVLKTDVVTYGVACKIFMEKHDAKVVKTWQEGDITWFAWAHSHKMKVNREILMKMFHHTIELRVWDSKEKCSSRARFDRPKAFRLPQAKPGEKPEDIGGVKAMVVRQMKNFMNQQPRKGNVIRPLPSQLSLQNLVYIRKHAQDTANQIAPSANTKQLVAVPTKEKLTGKSFDHLSQLAGSPRKTSPEKKKKNNAPGAGKPAVKEDKDTKKQQSELAKQLAENIKKHGLCMIPLRLAHLFSDHKVVTSRLENPIVGIEDMFLGVSVNIPLLSAQIKEELNPMMIKIQSATCLPDTPLSFEDLRTKCQPAYCRYKFFKEAEHDTSGKQQNKNIYWEDTNIVLLGTMEPCALREYLNGPPMIIELHDRDRKPEAVALKPTLFGDDLEDEKIANVGTVESRRTLHNPFSGRDKPWDPYGVAKLDLSELLLGHRFLELKIPIHNCPLPDILGSDKNYSGKLIGVPGAVDGPVDRPLSAGHYLENGSMLKVQIELAEALITPAALAAKEHIPTSIECPFSRIIYEFDYNNIEMLQSLQTLIMSFNAKALDLDALPQHVIDAALSTYKLSVVQQCSLDLDIVTGFHVLDGERHIFVLEGLRDKAICVIWDTLPQGLDVKVLYNSNLSFSKRLYGLLDVDLCRIKLHEPLSMIVQQPLLYIRDMVFKPCFEALIKLDQICKVNKMTEVVKCDLFPTPEMVVSMSREFGVPFTQKDFDDLHSSVQQKTDETFYHQRPYKPDPSRAWTPIDNFNQKYIEQLKAERKSHDFLQENIDEVHQKSLASAARKEKKLVLSVNVDPAYNYSTQHLNSGALAAEELRQYLMKQDPTARYAYNEEYLSGMVCPVDLEQEQKKQKAASKAKWRTENGWIFPGMKSMKEMNVHPQRPNSARVEELREEWMENAFHSNIFKSPIDRGRYPWSKRHEDLELYSKPPPGFGNHEHISMNLPWLQEAHDKQDFWFKEYVKWKSRLVVDDVEFHCHRVLPATEMTMQGFKSSNQLDRLKGLLKDPVMKLKKYASDANEIPPLAVVNDPLVDTVARQKGVELRPAIPAGFKAEFNGYKPGDGPESYQNPKNQVPCFNYEHEKFKKLRGQDFNVYHMNRSKFSHRPIHSLRPEERNNHLFPFSLVSWNHYSQPLPDLVQRSHTVGPWLNSSGHNQTSSSSNKINSETLLSVPHLSVPHLSVPHLSVPHLTDTPGPSSLEVNHPSLSLQHQTSVMA
ncbi:uncharacterized protein LOC131944620 isoform X2 [Physella acuta]|uniref:uncharacterized protein LOC131944620 isoform X2 n=1 Tax=Physella acuta TaxID=109671 RepID=UPI0027DB52EC|nr:uncharacterized protein LOC131944620 isoform X2 [Physella acuta]